MFNKTLDRAISDLKKGKFVLIHDDDDRENETDLMISAKFAEPEIIKTLRKDGGGLIFIMISNEIAKKFGLPYLSDLYSTIEKRYPVIKAVKANDIPYDKKSSFSLSVNHRKTYTGITDMDRSLTMKKFYELSNKIEKTEKNKATKMFGEEFRSPGHVPICIASKDLLRERMGHTELFVALLEMANITPVGTGCEMIGENGKALSKIKAKEYAKRKNIVFLEGNEIIDAWEKWSQ